MKRRRYLTISEAKFLGIKKINTPQKGKVSSRYLLNNDDYDRVVKFRNKDSEIESISTKIKSDTKVNDYKPNKPFVISAWDESNQRMLSLEEFCLKYNIDFNKVTTAKFLPYHYGVPTWNTCISEYKKDEENNVDLKKLRKTIKKETKRVYKYKDVKCNNNYETALKWADLHFGAHIRNLLLVEDYDQDVLLDGLMKSINMNNNFGFKKTHVHIHGDLIESFSGLNHVNSWQSMDKDAIGGNVIRMCSEMLHKALQKIDNLGCVKIVAGNHDRTSKANDEDVKGGAAELIAYCLELMGYNVEFHPYVITHKVGSINHIILHGDKGISKKSTEKIILDFGVQGEYNLICEAHLHSLMEKLSIKQRESFKVVKEDCLMHRRFTLPPFFKGNYYSATLGYSTNSGYFSVWSDEFNKPQFFNGSI